MRIVYPDAGKNLLNFLSKDLRTSLEQISYFKVFEGRPKTKEEYIERVRDADGILLGWYLPNDVMEQCERLKIVSYIGYGAKNFVDVEFAQKKGIKVTNTPGYGDNAVAEHSLALLLSIAKNITRNHNQLRNNGQWFQSDNSIEVKGKTIGLIGMGGIGKRMSELCKAIGMNVISWTFNPSKERSKELGVSFVSLEELFTQSDFISLHLPYSDKTSKIIGEKELTLLKPGAVLINTARAEIIDTEALIESLKQGRLAGAGLDVFDEEPISNDSPLLNMDNVILSPHVGFNTPESIKNILKISINNLLMYFSGTPENVINE